MIRFIAAAVLYALTWALGITVLLIGQRIYRAARPREWSWPQEHAWQEAMHAHAMAAWDRPVPGDDTMALLESAPSFDWSAPVARLFDEGEENQ